jgi:hypothetical protein
MSHSLRDSVAVHALNALSWAESVLIEAALDIDEDLASDYQGYRQVAAVLAEGFSDHVPAPSRRLWGRIAHAAGLPASAPPEPDGRDAGLAGRGGWARAAAVGVRRAAPGLLVTNITAWPVSKSPGRGSSRRL